MPRTIWSRLFGRERDFDPPQIFDLFQEAEPRHAGIIANFHNRIRQTRDEPATAADPRPAAAAPAAPVFSITDRVETAATAFGFTVRPVPVETVPEAPVTAPFLNRFEPVPEPVVEFVPSAGPGSGDPLVTVTPGPHDAAEGGDSRLFTVQVEWPWPLALGVLPITSDSASQARWEPIGWVETFLEQQAQLSPLAVGFGAEGFSDAAVGPPHWEAWAGPTLGSLDLSGDFSAGFTLTALSFDVDRITVRAGNDYVLVANDNFVGAGETLVVDAQALGADDRIMFDGMAETDGRFIFIGGDSDDFFFGGAGADWVEGGGGADVLSGGGGSDIFVYRAPSDSTGADYDTLADFNPEADRIDLPSAVAGFGPAIEGGALSHATFNDDLAAVLGGLGAGQAVWFAPDAGDLAGQVFLIVDGNGQPGYQDGEDYVIAVAGAPLADLTGHTDIFI